jgi:putative oxidoreductase
MEGKLARIVTAGPIRRGQDFGLLLLRVCAGAVLFLRHGWEKPTKFSMMAAHFPDPVHIGPHASLLFALVSDAICSVLVAIGLATRWASLVVLINVGVAWAFVHHFLFFGRAADHGEICALYLAIYLALLVAGPGRFSVDARLAACAEEDAHEARCAG